MRVEPVGAFADLAFHGLAHLPIQGTPSLHEPEYVDWCRRTLPVDAREPLAGDASAIAAQVDERGAGLALQWLPLLHSSLAAFDRTARRDLVDVTEADGTDTAALRCLRSVDPSAIEWLRADLLLTSASFAVAREAVAADVRGACAEIDAMLRLADENDRPELVHVACSLGAHGRGFRDVVFVGTCGTWNRLDAATPAIVAMHEHAVLRARGTHDRREWSALCSLARTLEGGPDTLRDAHARWLATLDLTSVVRAAVTSGHLDERISGQIEGSPDARASLLARLSP